MVSTRSNHGFYQGTFTLHRSSTILLKVLEGERDIILDSRGFSYCFNAHERDAVSDRFRELPAYGVIE